MKRIELKGLPAGGCSLCEANRISSERPSALSALVDRAREMGFEMRGMDVVEIHRDFNNKNKPYVSPVIYLGLRDSIRSAVISQREDEEVGTVVTIQNYFEFD